MIYIVCPSCKHGLRIASAEPGEVARMFGPGSEYHPASYPCFFCGEQKAKYALAMDASTLQQLEVFDVNPQEAVAAMHGLGLPAERECSASAVSQLLEGASIKSVRVRSIRNSHRSVIEFLELEDGIKVYFGASANGALIYRISRPTSYADRVLSEADHPGLPSSP